MEERIPMSTKELERLRVLNEVKEKRLKQSKAALLLGICPRQIRRLLQRLACDSLKGLLNNREERYMILPVVRDDCNLVLVAKGSRQTLKSLF